MLRYAFSTYNLIADRSIAVAASLVPGRLKRCLWDRTVFLLHILLATFAGKGEESASSRRSISVQEDDGGGRCGVSSVTG